MPKISVIIPVYNAEKYIERCIGSLKSQNTGDYEVILVDDGSTDGSPAICRRICEEDPRFCLISQSNKGPDMARSAGIAASAGQYLMFADADDYISEDIMDKLLSVIADTGADIVCGQYIRFDDNGREWDAPDNVNETLTYTDPSEILSAYLETRILKGSYWGKLIRRELFDDYEFMDESVVGEDICAMLHIFLKADRIVVIPDICYHYYWNYGSISHSGYTNRHALALSNYVKNRDSVLQRALIDEASVYGFFGEFMMSVATAMARAGVHDKPVALRLKKDMKDHIRSIRRNRYTPLYMKMCMQLYCISPALFICMYRILYLFTGR
ncbi:MAG: glycosyltransferase [Lachnospiraceae bacterium]|nr:glycosyltransferase [Lachnospiraceae bacterium]